ncbi:hypothetical protein MIND_01234900 [Mycena indigotica]|uniref:DUF6534 domain-containing protein n=1 Tax=Mycena indigotica TaxID=2126181 RepID=A0A8H6S2M5_9AGAR|nr:uncharacterized protein MIND_01234900 [Mycena indigotica]KAF7292085.1 hypothetical protein MIND_01234900 [Mycena indigotica]
MIPMPSFSNPAEAAHGPMLIGYVVCSYRLLRALRQRWGRTILNVLLMGVMIVQVYIYATTYSRDSKWIKVFIAVLTVADTLNTAFMIYYMYDTLILHFGDFNYLGSANWIFATDPAMVGLIGAMVEGFYAWRIFALTKSYIITGLVGFCAAADFFGAMATAAAISYIPQFARFTEFQETVIVWIVGATTADLLITGTLVFYLNTHRTGFSSTDTKLDKLIRLTMQTGMISFAFSMVHLGLYLGYPTGLHLLFNFPQSKLYSNSLMSTLNARGGWGQRTEAADSQHANYPNTGSNNVPLQVSVGVHSFSAVSSSNHGKKSFGRSAGDLDGVIDMDAELRKSHGV